MSKIVDAFVKDSKVGGYETEIRDLIDRLVRDKLDKIRTCSA